MLSEGPACHVIKMNVVIIVITNYHVQNLVIMLLVGPACHVIKMNVIEECHDHLNYHCHHAKSYQNAQHYNGYL